MAEIPKAWKQMESQHERLRVEYKIIINMNIFLKRWEYQTTLPTFWEICMQVKKQQLELDMEQQTVSKLRKEYVKAIYMQSTLWEMPDWMKHKLESRLPGEI